MSDRTSIAAMTNRLSAEQMERINRNVRPPSPWKSNGNRIYSADGEEIAVATKASPKYRARAEETARLLAAAPELIDALNGVVGEYLIQRADPDHPDHGFTVLPQWIERVRKALAEAQGLEYRSSEEDGWTK